MPGSLLFLSPHHPMLFLAAQFHWNPIALLPASTLAPPEAPESWTWSMVGLTDREQVPTIHPVPCRALPPSPQESYQPPHSTAFSEGRLSSFASANRIAASQVGAKIHKKAQGCYTISWAFYCTRHHSYCKLKQIPVKSRNSELLYYANLVRQLLRWNFRKGVFM